MTVMDTGTPDAYPTRMVSRSRRIERAHPTVWPAPNGSEHNGSEHNGSGPGGSGPGGSGPGGSVSSGPISPEDLAGHACKGFHIIPALLEHAEVARCRDELARLSTDPAVRADERTVVEKKSQEVRSIFEVHKISDLIGELAADQRVAGRARQILGTDVYVHQSRINFMPGFEGTGFYWHSDFETWHAEDGMPAPRAVSMSIALTDNYPFNGGLMVMPGSHSTYASCVGETPAENYKTSLRAQEIGTPDRDTLREMAQEYGIEQFTGPAGAALMFDCNVMHGSGNNITPFPRSNIFIVFNSIDNTLRAPYAAAAPRPTFIANRDFTPLARRG